MDLLSRLLVSMAFVILSPAICRANDAVFPGKAWEKRLPADVGLDAAKLEQFANRVGGDGCIVRDGFLVKTWGEVTRHKDWASAAKPVLSTLLLLAVQEGRIASVDAQVKDLGWDLSAKDSPMTFRHLANMVSGYGLDEPPGAAWGYNDFAIQLYAKSLERIFGSSLDAAFRQRMQMLDFEDGEVFGARNNTRVTASSRDFARLGWLWLNAGNWQGRQVLDRRLFEASFRAGVPASTPRAVIQQNDYLKIGSYGGGTNQTPSGPGAYGFNLWFNAVLDTGNRVWPALPADAYQANGMWNRDTVTVIPSWRMVVTSRDAHAGKFEPGNTDGEYNQNLKLLADAVLPTPQDVTKPPDANRRQVARWSPADFSFVHDSKLENPFRIQFSATVTRADGSRFETPGFYDGNNTWKIRVSSNSEGDWNLRTHSDEPALDGREAKWTVVANTNSKVHGLLRVDPQHPRHFIFEDGQRFFMLGYECDWLWSLDTGDSTLGTLTPFLDTLSNNGFNYLIMNTYAHDTSWRSGKTGEDDYGPPPRYAWAGTNEAPDHSRLNIAYWKHYDRVMNALFERGIVAHLMLKVYNKKVKWPQRDSADEDLFFRSMIARYAAYPNVVWDFSKEAHNEKNLDYKLGRLRFIRQHDPYRHLITTHDDTENYDAGVFDQTNDFRCDQQHSKLREFVLKQREQRSWPVANVEFGYEQGPKGPEDKTYRIAHTPEEFARRAWEVAMAGGYTAYYYTYTAWDVLRPADQPVGYMYFKLLREFFESTRYWELEPVVGTANGDWVLANSGQEYVVYRQSPGAVEMDLPKNETSYSGAWFQPLTGRRQTVTAITGGKQSLQAPSDWQSPAVLHLRGAQARSRE